MPLSLLEIQNLRNLTAIKIEPCPQFNLFYGPNGSGKTSLLEGIHYLSLGRSFRTRLNSRLINNQSNSFSIFGKIQSSYLTQSTSVGLERHSNGEARIRINRADAKSILEVTKLLPIRLLYSESRLILTGPSKLRRQLIDWGVFHVEHQFFQHWQHARRALKQRNMVLRTKTGRAMAKIWENELVQYSEQLNLFRKSHIELFQNVFMAVLPELLPDIDISIHYKPGWNEEIGLLSVLEQTWQRDLELGYTQHGPHRADLVIRVNKTVPAQDILSQGQQKLLVYALYLTQGILLKEQTSKSCIYLLDDLPAELDSKNRARVAAMLQKIGAQIFITGVDKEELSLLLEGYQASLFRVEQGEITP